MLVVVALRGRIWRSGRIIRRGVAKPESKRWWAKCKGEGEREAGCLCLSLTDSDWAFRTWLSP